MNLRLQRSDIQRCFLGKEIVNSAINPSLKSMHSNWWIYYLRVWELIELLTITMWDLFYKATNRRKMWVFLIHNKPKKFMVLVQGNKVLKLVKSLYRLKQVSIQWHENFDNEMMSNESKFNATSVWCEIYHKRLCCCGICSCKCCRCDTRNKFSNTSDGLILSQSHERCEDSLMRTPYIKSICIFGKSINLNRHA